MVSTGFRTGCTGCGAPSFRPLCDDCARAKILASGVAFYTAAKMARDWKLPSFYAECDTHGLTLFRAHEPSCLLCHPASRRGPRGNPARVEARRAGASSFLAQCQLHGETPHSVTRGKCLTCCDTQGRPRRQSPVAQRGDPARTEARRTGAASYTGRCEEHGETAFSTARGKCLTCFNAMGYPRKRDA